MRSDIVIHPKTANYLKEFQQHPRQNVLFYGEKGIGKTTLMLYAVSLFGSRPENIFQIIPSETGSIGIEEVRSMKRFLKLKSNQLGIKRFVVIHDADAMTEEAQNALLKSLEEPPVDTFLFLSASRRSYLLPTVLSRLEVHEITKPSVDAVSDYIKDMGAREDLRKILALSGGLPGLAVALARGEHNEFLETIKTAKDFIGAVVNDRLSKIDEFSKDRNRLASFLEACLTICRAAIESQIASPKNLSIWALKTEAVMRSIQLSERNVSSKLILTELAINL